MSAISVRGQPFRPRTSVSCRSGQRVVPPFSIQSLQKNSKVLEGPPKLQKRRYSDINQFVSWQGLIIFQANI